MMRGAMFELWQILVLPLALKDREITYCYQATQVVDSNLLKLSALMQTSPELPVWVACVDCALMNLPSDDLVWQR